MKLGLMQPYFLPYIGYFQAINEVDKYILYENLTFIKDGWMNRNRILIKDGSISFITVPILNKSSNNFIYDVRIDNTRKWNTKILKSIYLNYKGSKFFEEVYPLFEFLLNNSYVYLYELNAKMIIEISRFIGISTPIEFNNKEKYIQLEDKLLKIYQGDYNDFLNMNKTHPIKKVARILAILNYEFADVFVNAIGGMELYNKVEFAQYGIDLKFIQTDEFIYPQFLDKFIPNLSIIDVLMHNGKDGTMNLIKQYTLI